jgi:hypothetical protein
MNAEEVMRLMRVTTGSVVANHLEALSHCPVTRRELVIAARAAGVAERLWVPGDGETVSFTYIVEGSGIILLHSS